MYLPFTRSQLTPVSVAASAMMSTFISLNILFTGYNFEMILMTFLWVILQRVDHLFDGKLVITLS